jgi:hypothetical protein
MLCLYKICLVEMAELPAAQCELAWLAACCEWAVRDGLQAPPCIRGGPGG